MGVRGPIKIISKCLESQLDLIGAIEAFHARSSRSITCVAFHYFNAILCSRAKPRHLGRFLVAPVQVKL